ncbi:MAG: hypothetical protein HYS06_06500 [Methylocystis sp.]|nr:hypothetical protein [Methylocystis sp.]
MNNNVPPPGNTSLEALITSWKKSPYPSVKITSYFPAYVELFDHLRGTACTFIETGILDGGSLFMWRSWLGDNARIIGIDLNPEALKWKDHGFEIFIGDQGDPLFWQGTFKEIGEFDALLDDGGHQSFQQIVTAYEAIRRAKKKCVVVVEDTTTSFMKDFSKHGKYSFLEFSKDATDVLVGRSVNIDKGRFPSSINNEIVRNFHNTYSIQFFNGIVAYKLDPNYCIEPQVVRNMPPNSASDFRYKGVESAYVDWPHPFKRKSVIVKGGMNYRSKLKIIKSFIHKVIKKTKATVAADK